MGKIKKDAERVAQQIEELSCTFAKTVGESGKLFGSVTSMEIESYLKENGIDVDRKKILSGGTHQESGNVYCTDQTPSGGDRPTQGLGGSGVAVNERDGPFLPQTSSSEY